MNRRNLLKIFATASPLLIGSSYNKLDEYFYNELPEQSNQLNKLKILPRGLVSGKSKVAITATSSSMSASEMKDALNFLKQENISYEIGDTVKNNNASYRYLSASDDDRAAEFMKYIVDDTVDCILCGRGGYGVHRILEKLDFALIRKNPKIIVGFSDVTALISPIFEHTGLVTFHGPVAVSSFNTFTLNHFKNVLFSKNKFEPIITHEPNAIVITEGKAQGVLKGGNLRMIVSILGTPYEPNFDNSILFLEDVSEPAYKVDRMLSQLLISGKLKNCKGIIFGQFDNLNSRQPFHPGYSYTIKEVIEQLYSKLNIPIMIGMPFGHVKDKLTLPLGILAEIDTNNRSLTILERSVI